MADKCSERIFRGVGWGMRNCSRPPTVIRDGKPYCTQHDPERVARLRAKQAEEWARKHRQEVALRLLEGNAPRLLEALTRLCEAVEARAPFLEAEVKEARDLIARIQGRVG